MVEEIIGRLPQLSGSQLGRLEDELRRERQRRTSFADGEEDAPCVQEDVAPPVTEVLEYHPYEDGYMQLELRRYIRRDGSASERGPYWYFQFHEGGPNFGLDRTGEGNGPGHLGGPALCAGDGDRAQEALDDATAGAGEGSDKGQEVIRVRGYESPQLTERPRSASVPC